MKRASSVPALPASGTLPPAFSAGSSAAAQRNEARLFALQITRDPTYRETLLSLAQKGLLQPAVEQMIWAYAYGKPPDRIELGVADEPADLGDLSLEELYDRAQGVALRLAVVVQKVSTPAAVPAPAPPAPAAVQAAERLTNAALLRKLHVVPPPAPPAPAPAPSADPLSSLVARLSARGAFEPDPDEAAE